MLHRVATTSGRLCRAASQVAHKHSAAIGIKDLPESVYIDHGKPKATVPAPFKDPSEYKYGVVPDHPRYKKVMEMQELFSKIPGDHPMWKRMWYDKYVVGSTYLLAVVTTLYSFYNIYKIINNKY